MKNKEKLIEQYIDYLYGEDQYEQMYAPDIFQSKKDFIQGWNSAEQKLEKIINQIQKEDITSTVYILREVIKRMKE